MSKAKENPKVLMILPTLGQRTELLKQTLASLKAQSPFLYDLVMVFPLKNKETAALAKEYNAICIADPGGISAAINAGTTAAKPHHKYVGWLGDDDLLAPGSIKTSSTALDNNPDAVVAFGYCDYIDDVGNRIFTSRAGSLAPWIMTWGPNLVPLPGMMFRLSALNRIGGFDENNKYSMDLDVLLRMRKIGKIINTKRTLASFRWHSESTTVSSRTKSLKEASAVKRKYLPKYLRPFSPLWEAPVGVATKVAARRVTAAARKKSK
jgi:GT2 family glycosyltransferase